MAKRWIVLIGLCNALGHLLTMISMQMITPAITQIVRAFEPLLTSVLIYFILNEKSSCPQLLSIFAMMIGIVFIAIGKNTLSVNEYSNFLQGIIIAFCANGVMCFRNCGTKKYTILTKRQLDYPEVCSYSVRLLVVLIFIQISLFGWHYESPSTYLGIASLFHVGYR